MSYIDGFIIPVEDGRKQEFIDHANRMDAIFLEFGATRVVEAWADDVPDGEVTDFRKSVLAGDGESVVFSWIEWPDKETRDAGFAKMETDERMMAEPMPFDGKRMIFGGFAPLVDERITDGSAGYVDGFVTPVPEGNRDAYLAHAQEMLKTFPGMGLLSVFEGWADDVKDGKTTDFRRAVKATEGETVVFSFMQWPDKSARDAGWAKMMESGPPAGEMPFDGKRLFWGGFLPVVTLEK